MRLCLGLIVVVAGLAACGGGAQRPICSAQDALRAAVRTVDAMRSTDGAGSSEELDRQMDEVERLLRVARSNLAGGDLDPNTGAAARAMLEAANYLQFIVDDSRATGTVDFALTQFAARELNRAGAGAGGVPLNC